jgi:hypothetical protein
MIPTETLSCAAGRIASSADAARLEVDPREVIESVAALLEQVAVFRHPLGFLHFELTPLVVTTGSPRIRLHIWSETSLGWRDSLGLIHDHTWELRSLLLVGALTDVVLEAQTTPGGKFVGSRVRYSEAGTTIRRMDGSFHIREVQRRSVAPIHAYHLPPGSLHRTEVLGFPTATLVVATEANRNSASVYGRELPSMSGTPRRVLASRLEAAQGLRETLTAIEQLE